LLGVAVNVRTAPAHAGFELPVSAMLTDGVTFGFMVIVIAFDVAVTGLAQLKLDVIVQVMICPFVNVLVVYVELFVPTLTPLTFHW
jgi:hypothetical protein